MKLAVGGGAGGVSGAGGVDPNARVMAVLAQVGLTGATELPDGSIRLPDGRIVGDFSLGGETDAGDASDGKGRVGVGPAASRSLQGLPTNVGMIVERLEAEVRSGRENIQVCFTRIKEIQNNWE